MAEQETNDPYGLEILASIEHAGRFNKWIFDKIKPFCRDSILEIGSGIGNLSQYLLQHFNHVTLSDFNPDYITHLKKRFGNHEHLDDILLLHIASGHSFDSFPQHLMNQFETVIASNVIEHIQDDEHALADCAKLLRTGGKVIVLVPAYNWLYNKIDVQLGHYKRYTAESLRNVFIKNNFRVIDIHYFNSPGIFAWLLGGLMPGRKTIRPAQMKVYDALVPVFRLTDHLILRSAGLSVIGIAEKIK